MFDRIERYFDFAGNQTSFKTEVLGGVATFMTMAYIIFVNPGILKAAGMDFQAVMMATCVSSAVATAVMALVARYPIALAPGMGLNAFFTYELCLAQGASWQTALGIVFVSGLLFVGLTLVHFREALINAIPPALKYAIACGIGLFIAFIGLKNAGLVVASPATLITIGDLSSKTTLIAVAGLAATVLLWAAGVRGAILWGIFLAGGLGLASDAIALPTGFSPVAVPPSLGPTAFKLDIVGAVSSFKFVMLALVLLFFDLFDTVGTLIGVSEQAGFVDREGRLPRVNRALFADATGTMVGSVLGTSTVTSYIESATGVSAGARTGFSGLVVAALFLLSTFFSPLVGLFSQPFVTAPALIVVGALMMGSVAKIKWDDFSDAVPAFLTMLLMPLTFSISEGLLAGIFSWPLLKLAAGKRREVHPLIWALAAVTLVGVVLAKIFFRPAG